MKNSCWGRLVRWTSSPSVATLADGLEVRRTLNPSRNNFRCGGLKTSSKNTGHYDFNGPSRENDLKKVSSSTCGSQMRLRRYGGKLTKSKRLCQGWRYECFGPNQFRLRTTNASLHLLQRCHRTSTSRLCICKRS